MDLGIQNGTIVSHSLAESQNGTPYVKLKVNIEDEVVDVAVYLSDKAAGMARRALRLCGFDIDTESVYTLQTNTRKLAGNKVEINVHEEEWKGKVKVKYDIAIVDPALKESSVAGLDAMLRAAKADEESEEEAPKKKRSPRTSSSKPGALNAEAKAEAAANADNPEEF